MISRILRQKIRLNSKNFSYGYCASAAEPKKSNLAGTLSEKSQIFDEFSSKNSSNFGEISSKKLHFSGDDATSSGSNFAEDSVLEKWYVLSAKLTKHGFMKNAAQFKFHKEDNPNPCAPVWTAELSVNLENVRNSSENISNSQIFVGRTENYCLTKKQAKREAVQNLLEILETELGISCDLMKQKEDMWKKYKTISKSYLRAQALYETENDESTKIALAKWDTMSKLLKVLGYIKDPEWSIQRKPPIHKTWAWIGEAWLAELLVEFETGTDFEGHVISESTNDHCPSKRLAKKECIVKVVKVLEEKYNFNVERLQQEKDNRHRIDLLSDQNKSIISSSGRHHKPKSSCYTLITEFYVYHRKRDAFPDIQYSDFFDTVGIRYWTGKLHMHWPFKFSTEAKARSKRLVRNRLMEKVFEQFQKANLLTSNGSIAEKIERVKDQKDLYKQPQFVSLNETARTKIDQLMPEFKDLKFSLTNMLNESVIKKATVDSDPKNSQNETNAETGMLSNIAESRSTDVLDIITGIPLSKIRKTEYYTESRNRELLQRFKNLTNENARPAVKQMMEKRNALPIFAKRQEILDAIDQNRVVLIRGETGCGKTTQLPQYIFERHVESSRGSSCNIVVTQPRRISTISVAERIAAERFERPGDTVGYRVRLKQCKPRGNGSIFFTTPGMLLRSRLGNLDFQGVSHVIVDEVHERDIWTDFMLISLKRALTTNPALKLILMSATFGVEQFQAYFDDCPVIEVPGRTYPVKEYFLDDLSQHLNRSSTICPPPLPENLNPDRADESSLSSITDENDRVTTTQFGQRIPTDVDTVIDTLRYIHKNHEPGAILCFLPTTGDIRTVMQLLTQQNNNNNDLDDVIVLPCHSRLSVNEQKKVFDRPPDGVRKIILATNVAETSITIDDVRYVVNTGTSKSEIFDHEAKSLRTVEFWTSQASQTQRKGRAGRVAEGVCYHLFPKNYWDSFAPHSSPELLKKELNTVVLLAKLFSPNEEPAAFLSEAVDQPLPSQVQAAVQELVEMKFLDEFRNLTPMGERLAHFGCSPKLAKAMLYSVLLKCVDPVLSVSAMLEINQDIFDNTSDIDRSKINEVRHSALGTSYSDHVTFANLYNAYREQGLKIDTSNKALNDQEDPLDESEDTFKRLFEENALNRASFRLATDLRRIFASNLVSSKLAENLNDLLSLNSEINSFGSNENFIKCALAAGLHQNLFKLCPDSTVQNWRSRMTMIDNHRRKAFQTRSGGVLDKLAKDGVDSPVFWLMCHDRVLNVDGKSFRVDDLSLVDPKTCLLFSGYDLQPYGDSNAVLAPSRDFKFEFESAEDVKRLLFLRECFDQLAQWYCQGIPDKLKRRKTIGQLSTNRNNVIKFLINPSASQFSTNQNNATVSVVKNDESHDQLETTGQSETSDQSEQCFEKFNQFHSNLLDSLACLFTESAPKK